MLLLVADPSIGAVNAEKDCIARQSKNTFKGAVIHGPVSEGKCMICHGPHASGKSRLIKADIPALCLDCHDEPMKDAKGRSMPSVKAVFEDSELKLHKPFADGKCLCCHDPHASSHQRLLSRAHTESFYTSYTKEKYMCFGCHNEKAFTKPRTLSETNFRNGNLNLHYRHVNQKKGRSCQVCHDHHASKNAALIRSQVPFGEREISISEFEKSENGGKCAPSCHSIAQYNRIEPARNPIKVTPREGEEATPEELQRAATRLTHEPSVPSK